MAQTKCFDSEDTAENGHDETSGESEYDHDAIFAGFAELEPDPPERRPTCRSCGRPTPVCLCPYFPKQRLDLCTSLYIVQHPHEESRVLRTALLLTASLSPDKCHIIRGKRLSHSRHAELEAVCSHPNALLLYPGPEAIDISQVPCLPTENSDQAYRLILIDGTWPQAKYIFNNNKILHRPKQVQFSNVGISQYVIRTQPTDSALSTVESAAIALSILEGRPELQECVPSPPTRAGLHSASDTTLLAAQSLIKIRKSVERSSFFMLPHAYAILLAPLKALCEFQLQHGAVIHHSKERQLKMNESPPAEETKESPDEKMKEEDR